MRLGVLSGAIAVTRVDECAAAGDPGEVCRSATTARADAAAVTCALTLRVT